MTKEYVIENFTTNVSVDEHISCFRGERCFVESCKQCSDYGNSWGCPPFDFSTGEFLCQHEYVHLMVTKIIPVEKNIPIDRTQELIRPERLRIERELLEMGHRCRGQAFAYVGKRLYYPDSECVRRCNRPYLHLDKVRPLLEVFGFDMT